MQGNYVEMKLGLPLWSGIIFSNLFLGAMEISKTNYDWDNH